MSYTILGALRWWAREMPDRMALDIDGDSVSYGELWDWSRAIASQLRAKGVGVGDRIGLIGGQSTPLFAIALGAQHIGAIALPINTRFTERELAASFEDGGVCIVFAEPELRARALAAASEKVPVEDIEIVRGWRASDPIEKTDSFDPDRTTLIALMMTSGSTARPKMVQFNHDMVVSIALELQLIEPRVRHGRCLLFAPPFSGGLYTTFEYLVLGCSCFVQHRFEPDEALRIIEREKITVMPGATVFLERMAASPFFAETDLSSIAWATVGGARVPRELVETFRAKGMMLRCLFGQTEAGAAWAATGEALDHPEQAGYCGPFSDWKVVAGDRDAEAGEDGEIVIRSASVTPGYWQNDEATRETLREGWLHTGDIGRMSVDGSLTFVDRAKDIIISGGLNISAAEVEQAIGELPEIEEVAVIAAADEKFGETPMAIVRSGGRLDVAALIAHCNANLANYKVPRYVIEAEEPLPRNASGKIVKPILREIYASQARQRERVR